MKWAATVITGALVAGCYTQSDAETDAVAHLRKQVSSPVVEQMDNADPFCKGAIYCFRYRGIDATGQLQRGIIRSAWEKSA